jgi:hypothetical protein
MKMQHAIQATLAATVLLSSATAMGAKEATRPDLSGTYDTATLTPMQRPEMYGDKLELSKEDAEQIAARDAAGKLAQNKSSNPDRDAPPAGGDGSTGAAGNVGGYNTFWIDNGTSAVAVNGKYRTSIITDPPNGRMPAMTADAMQNMRRQFTGFERGNTGKAYWVNVGDGIGPYDNMEQRGLGERCLLGFGSTAGPPMMPVLYNNVKRIVQTDDYVMILVEMVHDARVIRLNSKHLPKEVRRWLGDSIGWWEGDTLVVDTTNFHPSSGFRGSSENLHVIERFKRLDDSTLLYSFTVDDPTVWTASWSGEYSWPATDEKLYEYACHEGNYALHGIMRGARVLEADVINAPAAAKGDSGE